MGGSGARQHGADLESRPNPSRQHRLSWRLALVAIAGLLIAASAPLSARLLWPGTLTEQPVVLKPWDSFGALANHPERPGRLDASLRHAER